MAVKNTKDYQKTYTKPQLRTELKENIKNSTKAGKKGQWSARKAQLLKKEYEAKGGGYVHKASKTASQKNLEKWSKSH